MKIQKASIVRLGERAIAEVTGAPVYMDAPLEAMVMTLGYATWGLFRMTLMPDNRIVIERESFPPEVSVETRKTNVCAAALDSLKEEKNAS